MTKKKVERIKEIFTELDGKLWAIQTGEMDSYVEAAVEVAKKKILVLVNNEPLIIPLKRRVSRNHEGEV